MKFTLVGSYLNVVLIRNILRDHYGENFKLQKRTGEVRVELPVSISATQWEALRTEIIKRCDKYKTKREEMTVFEITEEMGVEDESPLLVTASAAVAAFPKSPRLSNTSASKTSEPVGQQRSTPLSEAPEPPFISDDATQSSGMIPTCDDLEVPSLTEESLGSAYTVDIEPLSPDSNSQIGLYMDRIGVGRGSDVFTANARITHVPGKLAYTWIREGSNAVAIKRMDISVGKREFLLEYKALKRVNLINHSNLVQNLGDFIQKTTTAKYYNLVFPLAVGSLKQLFRGRFEGDHVFIGQRKSLANQFAGLASGLAYLHESSIAHRDIKPSNILLFQEDESRAITMRIADFGLLVVLTTRGDEGTTSSSSTTASKVWDTEASDNSGPPKREKAPRPEALFAEDIWDLGCVFTELLAYIYDGGLQGVARLREFITTSTQISSDEFSDPLASDGGEIKSQVLEWISEASRKDHTARELQPVLRKMFAEPSSRITATQVCLDISQMDFTEITWNDGIREVVLKPASSARRLTTVETFRRGVETWLGDRIDWWPLRPLPPICAPSDVIVGWKERTKTIYCCMDKPYSEPVDKRVYSMTKVEDMQDDEEFYTKVRKLIRDLNGTTNLTRWIFRGLYWKSCTKVDFIKFHVIRDNRESVLRHARELPQDVVNYEHGIPDPKDVQMQMMAEQIVRGLADPAYAAGERTAVRMLPKKLIPPPRTLRMGEPGWGIDFRMGFSPFKFVCWLSTCAVLTLGFVVVWLVLVSKTDLQNAFVPATFFFTIVTVAFGAMQIDQLVERGRG